MQVDGKGSVMAHKIFKYKDLQARARDAFGATEWEAVKRKDFMRVFVHSKNVKRINYNLW